MFSPTFSSDLIYVILRLVIGVTKSFLTRSLLVISNFALCATWMLFIILQFLDPLSYLHMTIESERLYCVVMLNTPRSASVAWFIRGARRTSRSIFRKAFPSRLSAERFVGPANVPYKAFFLTGFQATICGLTAMGGGTVSGVEGAPDADTWTFIFLSSSGESNDLLESNEIHHFVTERSITPDVTQKLACNLYSVNHLVLVNHRRATVRS